MRPAPRRRALRRLAGAAAGIWLAPSARAGGDPPVQWPAELPLLDGRRWGPAQFAGRAAVVVFFATDCPFCVRHMAHVQRLADTAGQRPMRVLAVAHDSDAEAVRRHLAHHGWHLPVTLAQAPLHAALSPKRVVPLTCVVNRAGVLREVIPGEMFEEDVMQLARWAERDAP